MRVLVFGASITQGFNDSAGGWVNRLWKYFSATGFEPRVFNLGVSGDSSSDVVNRFDSETRARARHGTIAVVFSFGINDTKIKHGKNFSNTDVYKRNLQKLWEMSRQFTDKVLFVGLTPCVEVQTNPVSWGDTVYTNSRIKEFDAVLKSFCEENGLAFVDTLKAFYDTHNWEKLISDGLHPNGEGHQLIADLVRPKLEEILK